MTVPVFGKESNFLNHDSGLAYTVTSIYNDVPMHKHNHYEFFIIPDGMAYHIINNAVQTVTKGDFYLIRPNDVHCYNFYHSENFGVHNLAFTTQIMQNVSLFLEQEKKVKTLLESEMPPHVHLEGEIFERVLRILDETGEIIDSGKPRHARYHAQVIIALFLEDFFLEGEERDSWTRIPDWLSELLLNMSKIENLQEGYPRMCSLAPCSASHLCRVMKEITGKTPTQYINQERLKYAVYLLSQTDREILDICESCGFSNLSHFYHLFSRQFGVSPVKFRKET